MRHLAKILVLTLALAACGGEEQSGPPESLTLIAHESFAEAVTDDTFAPFTDATGIAVDVIASNDAGTMVNQAVLSKDNPLADVMFGIDDNFLSRAVDEGIFQAHVAEGIDTVDAELRHEDDLVTPIDYGDVCFNYDKEWFDTAGIAVPDSLDTLATARVNSVALGNGPDPVLNLEGVGELQLSAVRSIR